LHSEFSLPAGLSERKARQRVTRNDDESFRPDRQIDVAEPGDGGLGRFADDASSL
jgi:hypothetical protein